MHMCMEYDDIRAYIFPLYITECIPEKNNSASVIWVQLNTS